MLSNLSAFVRVLVALIQFETKSNKTLKIFDYLKIYFTDGTYWCSIQIYDPVKNFDNNVTLLLTQDSLL